MQECDFGKCKSVIFGKHQSVIYNFRKTSKCDNLIVKNRKIRKTPFPENTPKNQSTADYYYTSMIHGPSPPWFWYPTWWLYSLSEWLDFRG